MSPDWCHWREDQLELRLYIQPNARRNEVTGLHANRLKVRIAAPPHDSKANGELLRFLAREFGVARSKISLLSGEACREKRVAISSPTIRPLWFTALSEPSMAIAPSEETKKRPYN